jgi:hypothetical protein
MDIWKWCSISHAQSGEERQKTTDLMQIAEAANKRGLEASTAALGCGPDGSGLKRARRGKDKPPPCSTHGDPDCHLARGVPKVLECVPLPEPRVPEPMHGEGWGPPVNIATLWVKYTSSGRRK